MEEHIAIWEVISPKIKPECYQAPRPTQHSQQIQRAGYMLIPASQSAKSQFNEEISRT